ncbi:MAG: hypothetical protein H7Z38_01805 [Rubrivivax sp.]|nr:hypothetical protein [Pyrinomonadaceae bacterium]
MGTRTRTRRSLYLFASAALLFAASLWASAAGAQSNRKEKPGGQSTAAPVASTPSDVVRAFYTAMRERRFQEAFAMSVYRPAVEGLSQPEFDELRPDFERIAAQVPAEVELTGEQISGEEATVFYKTGEGKEVKIIPIYLVRERGAWIIDDRESVALIKKQGKKFFFEQRIIAHEQDAEDMLKRIQAAQIAYAMQNSGTFGDLGALVRAGYVPQDILGTETTGYSFAVTPGAPGKGYLARAEPARYGRTGRLSFYLDQSGIQKKDTGGKPYNPPAPKK